MNDLNKYFKLNCIICNSNNILLELEEEEKESINLYFECQTCGNHYLEIYERV